MQRALDSIGVFFDHLSAVDGHAIAVAVGLHLIRGLAVSRAWRNVIADAYPEEKVPFRSVYGSYLARRRRQRAHPGARGRRGPARAAQEQDPVRDLHDARRLAGGDGHLRHDRGADALRLRANAERAAEPRRCPRPAELRLRLAVPAPAPAGRRSRSRSGSRSASASSGQSVTCAPSRRASARRSRFCGGRSAISAASPCGRRSTGRAASRRPTGSCARSTSTRPCATRSWRRSHRACPRCCRSARAASAPSRRCSSSSSPARRRTARFSR